jgi:hypothetical protein
VRALNPIADILIYSGGSFIHHHFACRDNRFVPAEGYFLRSMDIGNVEFVFFYESARGTSYDLWILFILSKCGACGTLTDL